MLLRHGEVKYLIQGHTTNPAHMPVSSSAFHFSFPCRVSVLEEQTGKPAEQPGLRSLHYVGISRAEQCYSFSLGSKPLTLSSDREVGLLIWGEGLGSTVEARLAFGSQLTSELQPRAPALGSSIVLPPSLPGSHYIPKRN